MIDPFELGLRTGEPKASTYTGAETGAAGKLKPVGIRG